MTLGQPSVGTFASVLTRLRKGAGMTQEELAARCGLSARGIGNLERDRRRPRRFTVELLVDGLGLAGDDRGALLAAADRAHIAAVRERKPADRGGRVTGEPDPGTSRASAELAVADEHFLGARHSDAVAVASRAIEAARTCGDEATLSACYLRRGISARCLGESESGYRDLHTAASLAELAGARKTLARALTAIAVAHHYNGELTRADAHFDRVLVLASELGDDEVLSRAVCNRGASALWLGEWKPALSRFEQARELGRRGGSAVCEATALISRATLLIASGRHEQASVDLERALALGARTGNLDVIRNATGIQAESDIRTGRPERALNRLLPLLDRPGLREWQVTDIMPVLAEGYFASGMVGAACRTADGAVARARAADHTLALADALRVRALVVAAEPQRSVATECLDEAFGLAQSMKAPYVEVRVRATAAGLATRRRDLATARRERSRADAVFEELRADVVATVDHTDVNRPSGGCGAGQGSGRSRDPC